MAKKSPTELTLKDLRLAYPLVQKVEHWNSFARRRVDLFGVIDIVAVGDGHTIGVQCTTDSNMSARVNKIQEIPDVVKTLKAANWKVQVWGWKKVGGKWQKRIVEIT